jgi:hypothetical protein
MTKAENRAAAKADFLVPPAVPGWYRSSSRPTAKPHSGTARTQARSQPDTIPPSSNSPPTRLFADPEAAARKLIEIDNSVKAVQEGRIHIELFRQETSSKSESSPGTIGLDQRLSD